MRLADDITLTVGSHRAPICLRASLRAATILEQKYNGFDKLLAQVADGNLGAIADVLSVGHGQVDLLDALDGVPLADAIPSLTDAVSRHVLALAGIDPDNPDPDPDSDGERMTFAEYHAKLYQIATGWLCWSPNQAWSATPSEILEAYSGHLDMLRAIYGSAEQGQSVPDKPDSAKLDSEGLHALKTLGRAV